MKKLINKLLELLNIHDPLDVLTQMQNYIAGLLKANLNNKQLKIKLIQDVNSIEKAKKEYKLNMQTNIIAENLAFALIL